MSTECFILALRRFIARRGRVKTIYCDNGSGFVGCYNLLKSIHWPKILEYANINKIEWHFNPPSAPWWGGFWERMVRTLKDLLKRNLGKACLDYEELLTVVLDCEAVINSRPITYFNEDPSEPVALTPAMFIQPIVESNVADLDHLDSKILLKRTKYMNVLRENLRNRFRKEYLSQLIAHVPRKDRAVSVGEVVLIGSDDKVRLNWPLGLVLELCPGKDGVCRVAKLRTKSGILVRPLQRLYPLEISSGEGNKDLLISKKSENSNKTSNVGNGEQISLNRFSRYGRLIKAPIKPNV